MDLKDYFDVSSIHGFGHINGQKSFGKLFWLFVIFSAFVCAGVLVGQSFESWGNNPISTVIETRPILESNFPDVVVCPPENTFTNLNQDLMNADKTELDENLRQSLVSHITEMILDEEFFDAYAVQNDIFEANKYKNWYTGFTLASLSESKLVQVSTSSEFGSFTTPNYGKPFKADKFQIEADYEILITPPRNISRFRSGKGYDKLCVEITKDTADSSIQEVTEFVKWYQGYNFAQLLDGFKTEKRCFKGKDFKQSISRARYAKVAFSRLFSQRAYEGWTKKRFTGMSVSWYYTDSEGEKINIVPEPKYLNDEQNKNFVALVTLVGNHPREDLWRKLKRFKVDTVNKESFTQSCEFTTSGTTSTFKMKQISLFLGEILEDLGLENKTEPLNPDTIEESTLNVAAAMFIYLAKCPSLLSKSFLIDPLEKFTESASTATIWEAFINVYRNSLTKKPKGINFPMDALEDIISIIGEKIDSTLTLLDALSLSKRSFLQIKDENILFKSLSGEVRECLEDNNFCLKNALANIINSTFGLHPVHIASDAPSSFIPFCSLGGNMMAVGKIFPDFPVPVCSSFEPFLLDYQVILLIHSIVSMIKLMF